MNEANEMEENGQEISDTEDKVNKMPISIKKNKSDVLTNQIDLKTLFVLSSYGNKSLKSKVQDCLSLFTALYENCLKVEQLLKHLSTNLIKKHDFKFELENLEFSSH